MDYLGLSGDDGYDDYDLSTEYERPVRSSRMPPAEPLTRGRGGYEPEYVQDISRPAPRGRIDDTGNVRRPDDSLGVRPVGTPRTSATVRPVVSQGEPVTVRPRNFNQAQEVADHFKEGQPVIVNLEGADKDMSRRIIDFASGLCYALGGSMEKVGSGVYLLKPSAGVDVGRY